MPNIPLLLWGTVYYRTFCGQELAVQSIEVLKRPSGVEHKLLTIWVEKDGSMLLSMSVQKWVEKARVQVL